MSELQARNRAVWSAGDWDDASRIIESVGPRVLDLVDLAGGMDVLDVGTGSGGNIAIPAAQRGARVVGSDLTDHWFGAARERADAAGVEVEWVEADVEDLPFADASFDRVISTFGHMFAPHHAVAAAEMVRVCRPDGLIATATWPLDSFPGESFRISGAAMPPPPPGVEPPFAWGDPDHASTLYGALGWEAELRTDRVRFTFESIDAFVEWSERSFPPIVMMRQVLGDRYAAVAEETRAMIERRNGASDGTLDLELEYLVTLVRRG